MDCSAKAALAAPCGVQRRRGGRREGHWLGRGKKRSVTNKVVKHSRAESSWPTLCRCFTGLSSRRCLSKQRSYFLAWQSHVSLSNTERFHCVSLSRCRFLRPTGQRLMSPWRYLECGLVFWTPPHDSCCLFSRSCSRDRCQGLCVYVHTWGAWYVLPNGAEILNSGYQARNVNKQLLHQNLALKVVWPWWWLVSALSDWVWLCFKFRGSVLSQMGQIYFQKLIEILVKGKTSQYNWSSYIKNVNAFKNKSDWFKVVQLMSHFYHSV